MSKMLDGVTKSIGLIKHVCCSLEDATYKFEGIKLIESYGKMEQIFSMFRESLEGGRSNGCKLFQDG